MRQPYQILNLLYKKDENNNLLYGVLLRKKQNVWQFVAGGGEENEAPIQTAKRELKEETGIEIKDNEITKLDAISTIPVVNITGEFTWGKNVYVIPEYTFAINATNKKVKISNEHKKIEWLRYENAMKKLEFDSNKTALWELNEKLKRK